ncbi:hypothetical protein AAY473_012700 [Plecturocebus cupreus]
MIPDVADTTLLSQFKMCRKAAEPTCNINNSFGPGAAKNIQCSGNLRSFAKKMRALKLRSTVACHRKWTITNWEQSLRLNLLQLHKKLLKNSASTMLWAARVLMGMVTVVTDVCVDTSIGHNLQKQLHSGESCKTATQTMGKEEHKARKRSENFQTFKSREIKITAKED